MKHEGISRDCKSAQVDEIEIFLTIPREMIILPKKSLPYVIVLIIIVLG